MSKSYQAPTLPDELAPDLANRISFVKAKYEEAKGEGYQAFTRARAQQASAEDALHRGQKGDHEALMEGITNPKGETVQPGVRSLDLYAQMKWAEAKAFKAELDKLEAQKATAEPAKEATPDGN